MGILAALYRIISKVEYEAVEFFCWVFFLPKQDDVMVIHLSARKVVHLSARQNSGIVYSAQEGN